MGSQRGSPENGIFCRAHPPLTVPTGAQFSLRCRSARFYAAQHRLTGRPVRIETVSKSHLPKTGIFLARVGDFREFSVEKFESRPTRDPAMSKKPAVGGPFNCLRRIFSNYSTGWLAKQWGSRRSPADFPANREFYREITEFHGMRG